MRQGAAVTGYVKAVTSGERIVEPDAGGATPNGANGHAFISLSSVLLGSVVGLALAAVVCLALGWQHRTPDIPLSEDFSSLTSVLWRATIVVGGALVLVVGYLALGRVYRASAGRRAKFVAYTAPLLFVVATAALVAQWRGQAAKAFRVAADAQIALHPFSVTTVARSAWWFACFAVGVLAVVCAGAYRADADLPSCAPKRWVAAVVVAVVIPAVLVTPVVKAAIKSPFNSQTASPIHVSTLTALSGQVAYRAKVGMLATYIRPAGAGWVHVAEGSGHGHESVEGFDGATGQRRWSFSAPELSVGTMRTSGAGPESVVLLKVYIPIDALIALDAMTGALLWARVDDKTFDEKYPLSARVMLLESPSSVPGDQQWTAVSVRTGDTLWTKTFRKDCGVETAAADSAVLLHTCDDGPDVVAQVLDPKTGERTAVISASTLGLTPDKAGALRFGRPVGDRVIISGPQDRLVVDIPSARAVARIPDNQDAEFIDSESLMLTMPLADHKVAQPVSILNLRDGGIIETGLFAQWQGAQQSWQSIARVGDQWLTLLPDAQWLSQLGSATPGTKLTPPEMRIIGKSGQAQTLPNPCDGRLEANPVVSPVPGAVLVACGTVDAVAAIR